MKPLPVPALDQTLERLERTVSGVVDDRTLAATRERIAAAHLHAGPAQRALEEFAARRDAAGGNWMAAAWLEDYLAVRGPLPLTTNVTFQVGGDFGAPGVGRAARFLRRAAAVHLTQSRGETEPEVDGRGTVLDAAQWACLDGGARHPRPDVDAVLPGPGTAAGREIGLIRAGRLFLVPASDDAGHPLTEEHFAAAVRAVVAATEPGEPEGSHGDLTGDGADAPEVSGAVSADPLPFAAPSVLGSAVLAGPLARLLEDEHNARAYRRLSDALFTFTIADEPREGAAAERLRRATVEPGRAWAYKPISYGGSLTDGWIALHCEHSTVDGATLVGVLRRIQAAESAPEPADAETAPAAGLDSGPGTDAGAGRVPEAGADVVPEELTWRMDEGTAATLRAALVDYTEQAARFRVDLVSVPRPDVSGLDMRVSVDFLQQAVMAIAQQRAFGRVRAVYESVDMREHAAGRTECLRPLTPAMAALAEALADGLPEDEASDRADDDAAQDTADERGTAGLRALFTQALDAHRDWVKACKAGAGVDRHLWGLAKATTGRLDVGPDVGEPSEDGGLGEEAVEAVAELLTDPGVVAAREDFLSTTSIGGAEQIVRYAFAPSVADGYGISYTPGEDEFEFCVSSWTGPGGAPGPARDRFLAELARAAGVLGEAVDAIAAEAQETEETPAPAGEGAAPAAVAEASTPAPTPPAEG